MPTKRHSMAKLKFFLLLLVAVGIQAEYDNTQCRSTLKGTEYSGTISQTKNGRICQRWDTDNDPHDITLYWDGKFPENSRSAAENYCRNPDSSSGGPWCYTTDPDVRWEYCQIDHCFGFVSSVEPRHIGQGGAVRVTLHGEGFADNQFNFGGDSHVGNKVWFVNDLTSVECEMFPDGSTEEMIQCYSPEGMYDAQWKVRLSVDGVETPTDVGICNGYPDSWTCSVRPAEWWSPYIDYVEPRAGLGDEIITIYGRFFTDLYGPEVAQATNGKTEKVLRVYVNGRSCALKDGDDFYGMQLDSSSSNNGYIKCKVDAGAAFSSNVSVIIDAPYGRTYVKPTAYHLSGVGKVNMFQSYAAIDSISAQTGSIYGGQLLTITGRFFDDTKAAPDVKVGDEECVVESLTETEITCRTPAQPGSSRDTYVGNRGMNHEFFNSTLPNWDTVETFRDREDGVPFWTHSAYWCESYDKECQIPAGTDLYGVRSTGYFVPRLSGEYQFYSKVDDWAKIYVGPDSDNLTSLLNITSHTSSSYYRYSMQASERMNLTAGEPLYFEALTREGYSHAYMYLGAKYFQPDLVQKIDGKVEPEVQTIAMSSTEDTEDIMLTLNGFSSRTPTYEVQVVTMTYTDIDGIWQLGMNDVYTDILDVDTSAIDLQNALNDLPTIAPERVQVTSVEITSGRTYTITFSSVLGDWPELTRKRSGGAEVSISTTTHGTASLSKWRLHLEHDGSDLLSDDLIAMNPSQEQMEEAVNSLFSARCPPSIGDRASGKWFYEGHESRSSPGYKGGIIDVESEPFCGRASGKNVARLYDSSDIDITANGYICFAYRGVFRDLIRIKVRTQVRHSNIYAEYTFRQSEDGTEWFYHCIDLLEYAETWYPNEAPYKLTDFEVYRWSHNDIWVDEVVIAGKPTTLFNETVVTDRRIPLTARVQDISVVKNESVNTFSFSISPYNCANNFKMLKAYNAPQLSGSTSTGSSSVTFGDSGTVWPAGATLKVDRSLKASPPVSGTWTLTSDSYTSTFDADIEANVLQTNLAQYHNLGEVKVTREGSCYGYVYDLEYTQTTGGNIPSLAVDGSGLSGNDEMIEITKNDAHIFYDPIPGDMFATAEATPQVRVAINDINARCFGDCSYAWSQDVSPSVSSCSPSSGSSGTELTITGDMFSTTNSENLVLVGEAKCDVTSSTATEIVCDLMAGTIGNHPVDVFVSSLGKADSSVNFDYDAGSVNAVSPSEGSEAGGTYITLTGSGFSSSATVTVGGSSCEVISVMASEIVCETPSGSGSVDVAVTATQTLTCSPCFDFSSSVTPSVTSFSPSNPMASGTEDLSLAGTFTGIDDLQDVVELYLVDSAGSVQSLSIDWDASNETQITAPLPPLADGSYTLKLRFGTTIGFASFSSTPTLSVALKVDGISVKKGSFEGGTRLGISGTGFGTDKDLVSVMVGESECEIKELSDTEITCMTGRGSRIVNITNGGIDPVYGLGYAWSPQVADIVAGDKVRFIWTSPLFVTANDFKVMQTPDAESASDGTGFDSGAGSPSGEFIHQFDTTGTFFYTTGMIGTTENVELRGKINVAAKASYSTDVKVYVAGVMATADTGGSVDESGLACQGTTADITGCSESDPNSGGDLEFSFLLCSTPEVTAVDESQGYIDTDITIDGDGFSTTACDNEVMIGDHTCVVSQQSASELVCAPDIAEEPDVGISFPIKVRVNNRGYALMAGLEPTFAILPSLTSVTPSTGSTDGGTMLTLDGAGFVGETEVMLGLDSCEITSQTYTQIVCMTSSAPAASHDVTITVTNSLDTQLPVACPTSDCTFAFDAASTPTIVTVEEPSDLKIKEALTNISVTGTGFGTNADDLRVMLGDYNCTVMAITDTSFVCTVGPIPKGSHDLNVHVAGKGYGFGPSIASRVKLDSINPSTGSVYGGQVVTIAGTGFRSGETEVTINGVDCTINSVTVTEITCTTGASAEGTGLVVDVMVNGGSDTDLTFEYSTSITPEVTSLAPSSGVEGDAVTIAGTGFGSTNAESTVTIGGAACVVTSSSPTSITCTAGGWYPGEAHVMVNVDMIGYSNSDVTFTYELNPTSLSGNEGSFGGGKQLTIGGSGFIDGVMVKLCDEMAVVTNVTPTAIALLSPGYDAVPSGDLECDVTVSIGNESVVMTDKFTYTIDLTPVIASVSPARGGTLGGTRITLTGTKFSNAGENAVTIAGAVCDIETETATEIVCTTNSPDMPEGSSYRSQKTTVMLEVGTNGLAIPEEADYWYVDVWSSAATWGNGPLPTEGDLVVIPAGQLLLLDQDTPVLAMLLIQGGELVFDDVDLTLRSENILIVDDGRLTVGTEDKPFTNDATIELHGQLRSPELPIYGAKCLAVREGELNLHGKPLRMTWTRLSSTATAGSTQIELEWGQADWPVGGTIAIATTGDRHSQAETELRNITAISNDGRTISFDEPLVYDHLGVTEQLGGGHTLEMRAEVALLSRNVRVIGSRDIQWSDEIEACPDGFDTGEFATQTCFQGRFGDEIGSDQFGAQIMFHAPVKDSMRARGKLSYIEVNYAGQAFRLGRYPVHFHLNGDMSGSYVKGLAIHETFNRAVNIHGSHNVSIEHTVIYDIMGGAFFLEDGIETGNIYRYNLALFVKASSSLLNDDITPAAFWATNPDNHYEHNAVAGGTHFGFWYRLLEHPEGPSATTSVCPRRVPLGTSYNNTVHSNGWFGLWTFQDYYPMVGGGCDSNDPEPAVFEKFIVWNCEKGLEFVNGGSLQFVDCLLANNKLTALEGKKNMLLGVEAPYSDKGPMIRDSVVAAYAPNYPHSSGGARVGIVLPWSAGFSVRNVTFINFDQPNEAIFGMTAIQGTCSELCGGWNYHMEQISFINGDQQRSNFRWPHDGVFVDLDGSYSGAAGNKVLPWLDTMDPSKCMKDAKFSVGAAEGAVCDSTTKFARLSFNHPSLDSMLFKNVLFTNEFGTHIAPFADKRMTHKTGWTTVVESGQDYKVVWENIEHIVNISYDAIFEDLEGFSVIITHNVSSKPDRVKVSGAVRDIEEASPNKLDTETNYHGDFYFNDNDRELSYMVSYRKAARKRRSDNNDYLFENVNFEGIKCYWPDCEPPPDQNTLPPITSRPDPFHWWSDTSIWPNDVLPEEGDDVEIAAGMWVVADVPFKKMRSLVLMGNLELDPDKDPNTDEYRDFVLEVEYLIIKGGRLVVGWEDKRFLGNVEIILHGDQYSDNYPQTSGATIGQKVIAVYGGLDLHGKQRETLTTTLSETAQAGASSIMLSQETDWEAGEKIMLTATSYDAQETEVVIITAVSGKEISFSPALMYKHLGETLNMESSDTSYSLASEVALLTRNVVVRGGSHPDMERLGFGGRILVSTSIAEDNTALVGWARVSYTQFENMGQLGFSEAFDPRYAIAYVQTGETSSVKPSLLKGNSFDTSFSPAIGLFGCSDINVQYNVMYQVVGGGMVVFGNDHLIEGNLIALNLWTGSYQGRREAKNVAYEASFEMVGAGDIDFRNNIAAGSERAGFRVRGELCGEEPRYTGNRAHATMFGVMMWEGDEISLTCFQVSQYTSWKAYDYGIFIQTPGDKIELNDNVLIENGLGVWTNTYSPGSLSHIVREKSVTVNRGYLSGATDSFDCTTDMKPSGTNWEFSSLARSWRIDGGMVGFSFPNADSGANGLPTHPFRGRMSYPSIDGVQHMEGVTFGNLRERTCGGEMVRDYAISTNPSADDLAHLVTVSDAQVEGTVEKESLVYYHRANVGKVNPSDCVDMVCDGHRKALLNDMDGQFMGSDNAGFIVDDATNEWDGDARYGVGDYRIPKVMLTYPNSTRMAPPPNKGIYLNNECVYQDSWQAFECHDTVYKLLVIESMDADTEVRRLSPIGLKSRTGQYIDLLNGPQDHGWCAGYTCQKRISTFWAVVATGQTYDLYMTGSNPQHTRFYMLQADDSDKVNLAVYYHSPMRLDIFADDVYIYPKNAEIESDGDYKLLESAQSPSEYIPDVSSDAHGQNYFDREWQLQYFILGGTNKVDVIMKEVVIVSLSLPPMTVDDFFGENIVSNLATFLGIPANKIRIVDVVRETSSRRKRQEEGVTLDLEIGDAPEEGQAVEDVNSGDLPRDLLLNLTRKVVDAVQLGTLGDALNVSILGIDVQEPLPIPENSTSSDWASLSNSSSLAAFIQIPTQMTYAVQLVGDREQQPFPTQPQFEMYDANGDLVEVLGSRADPWKIRAVLNINGGHEDAVLIGETICGFQDGVCAFETLGISHSGSGYTIDFEIFDPAEAAYADVSAPITLREAELAAGFAYVPDKDMPVMIDEVFGAVVDIRDLSSQLTIDDIAWKDHTWRATLSIYAPEMSPSGAMLYGTLEADFDSATGIANFTDLSLNMAGRYFLKATVVSTPADYTITGRSSVIEVKQNVTMQDEDVSYNFTLRSSLDYDMYAEGMEDLIEASVFNYLQSIDPSARYHDFSIYSGSIYVTFWASGENDPMLTVVDSIEQAIDTGLSLVLPDVQLSFEKYLMVDGDVYGGLDGMTTASSQEPGEMTTGGVTEAPGKNKVPLIIGIVIAALVIIAVAVAVSFVIIKKKSAGKTEHADDYAASSNSSTPDPEQPSKVVE